jgi:hypothetical protein
VALVKFGSCEVVEASKPSGGWKWIKGRDPVTQKEAATQSAEVEELLPVR